MALRKNVIPYAAMEKLLKKAGAERVSDDAKMMLADILEEKAQEVGIQAVRIAKHAGRKTIKASDLKIAQK